MRKFIIQALMFLAIQLVLLTGLVILSKPDAQSWTAAGADKRRLLQTTPPPRIVYIGGSGAAFSYDSRVIKRELGLNPVNLGLHAGLGLPFMLAEAESGLREGDVVVVSLEYAHFLADQTEWALVLKEVTLDPGVLRCFTPRMLAGLLDHGLSLATIYVRGLIFHPAAPLAYHRDSFNEFGDAVKHWQDPQTSRIFAMVEAAKLQTARPRFPAHASKVIDQLSRFDRWCRDHAVKVYWAYPAVAEFAFNLTLSQRIDKELVQRLPVPRLNRPEEGVYPNEMFYDSEYHPNFQGTAARTQAMVERLKAVLKPSP